MVLCQIPSWMRIVLCAMLGSAALTIAAARAQTPVFTTLEWPPYVSESLPDGGASTAVVRAAFRAAGGDVAFRFAPWARAVEMAIDGADGVVAVFPMYENDERDGVVCTRPIGFGPLGFAQPAAAPVVWATLTDVARLRIGVVRGFSNTMEFDRMAEEGLLRTDDARSDVANLRKIQLGRLDLAVIDPNVMAFITATDDRVDPRSLSFNARTLEDKTLHACFGEGPAARTARETFETGLARIDPTAIQSRSIDIALRR